MTAPREPAPSICRRLPGSESQLMRLVNAMCDGTASHADAVALEALLADPANRDFYLAATELHTSLLWRWQSSESATPPHRGPTDPAGISSSQGLSAKRQAGAEPGRRFAAAIGALRRTVIAWARSLSRPLPFSCLVAAAFLGGVISVISILHISPAAAARAGRLATITGLHDVVWSAGATTHSRMARLDVGDTLEVERGLVELSYDSGALVVIEGPARYEVRSKAAGRLTGGRVTAKTVHPNPRPGTVPEPLFTIVTPSGVIHDLGTEFGVEVHRSSGLAAVHVFEGLVELAAADRASTPDASLVRLIAGEAAQMDESGKIVPASASLRQRFVRSLPKPGNDHDRVASTVWERIGWNDETAVIVYRDTFRGAGPLAGTTPASRGGIGREAWIAPVQGWDLTADGLAVEAGSACAWLPFAPQPNRLYRLTAEMHTKGGEWLAAGFASNPSSIQKAIHLAAGASIWCLQRHHPRLFARNQLFVAPKLMIDADTVSGSVTRMVVIDTRTPATAHFLLGDRLLRSVPLATFDSLTAAVLSALAAHGSVRGIRLEMSTIENEVRASASTTQSKSGPLP